MKTVNTLGQFFLKLTNNLLLKVKVFLKHNETMSRMDKKEYRPFRPRDQNGNVYYRIGPA